MESWLSGGVTGDGCLHAPSPLEARVFVRGYDTHRPGRQSKTPGAVVDRACALVVESQNPIPKGILDARRGILWELEVGRVPFLESCPFQKMLRLRHHWRRRCDG